MTQEVFNYEPIQGIIVGEEEELISSSESMSESVAISITADGNPTNSMSESVSVIVL